VIFKPCSFNSAFFFSGTALPGKLNPMYGKISPFKNKKHTDESKKKPK
jgi:hypothetical protein